ncbi:MAG: phospholipid carrier-dependent glycosyltransferase [Oscillospiraceae bacterium]
MSRLTLIFPIAAGIFLLLVFLEYLPCLRRDLAPAPEPDKRFSRRDAAAAGVITLAYAVTAFTGLGVNSAPQSFHHFRGAGDSVLIQLDGETELGALMYYTGLHTGDYSLQLSADGETWTEPAAMPQGYADLFKWNYADLPESAGPVRYVRIEAQRELNLGELALYDARGELIPAESLCCDGAEALFDEQDTVPESPSFLNSSYFDEIYHARTALEHIEGENPYEITHPPLGKLIIGLGIRLFGMTPFGWRSMGTLFGVLMVPALYVFLKKMFGGTAVPACCTAVFAFDFMHFVQTRLATIDTYGVFFTLLMYLFLYLYLTAERGVGAPKWKWLLPLALCGLSFGLGAASKWTCLYAGAGLGLLWLIDRVRRWLAARREDRQSAHWGENGRNAYWRETGENVLWCLLFFVALPCLIYYLSYYAYGRARGMEGVGMFFTRDYLNLVLDNQKYMFSYHSGVNATHPYSSRWWQWILDIRPILYYQEYFDDGTKSAFGAFVNPMLCWGGLLAMLSMAYLALFRRDKKAAFILLGYLAQLLPWVFVGRITFEYHYFPSTVFLTLALGHVFTSVWQYSPGRKRLLFSFTAVSLVLFAAFYPVLSGLRVPTWYTYGFLRWLPGWPF